MDCYGILETGPESYGKSGRDLRQLRSAARLEREAQEVRVNQAKIPRLSRDVSVGVDIRDCRCFQICRIGRGLWREET